MTEPIGCLPKTGQDKHLKLSPQGYILFLKSFFDKKHTKRPGKYPWQELFKTPQALIFFGIPPFQNLGLKVVPRPAERRSI